MPQIGAGQPVGPGVRRAVAQELVEMLAVDHADKAVLDRDIDVRLVGETIRAS